jgi:transposase
MKHAAASSKNRLPAAVGDARRKHASPENEFLGYSFKYRRGLPYSAGLRASVISAVRAGASCRNVAAQYGLSNSTVGKWMLQFCRTGSVAAKPMGGNRFSRLRDEHDWIVARIAAEPDLTLAELHQELSARGVRVGYLSVKRYLRVRPETLDWIAKFSEHEAD